MQPRIIVGRSRPAFKIVGAPQGGEPRDLTGTARTSFIPEQAIDADLPHFRLVSSTPSIRFTLTGTAPLAPLSGAPIPAVEVINQLSSTSILTGTPAVGVPTADFASALTATGISTGTPTVGSPTVAQCNIIIQSMTSQTSAYREQLGDQTTRQWVASKFVAGSSAKVCALAADLIQNGSPTGNITVHIYSHDSVNDRPNVEVGTGSSAKAASSFPTTHVEGDYEIFWDMDVDLVSGTTYWIVGKSSTVSGTDYVWWYLGTPTGSRLMMGSSAPAWALEGVYALKYKLYRS